MELETRYRIFKIVRSSTSRPDIYHHVLEGCNAEEYVNEQEAKNWILEHGDYRTAQHEYVILPCLKPVKG